MSFRVATLNLEQDHKRWLDRRELIVDQMERLCPDVLAINEVCIPLQTGRFLQRAATRQLGVDYNLVQQSKVNGLSQVDGEGLITKFLVRETADSPVDESQIGCSEFVSKPHPLCTFAMRWRIRRDSPTLFADSVTR